MEKTLSEKRFPLGNTIDGNYARAFWENDVKQAVKNLKEELCQRLIKNKPCNICINCKIINQEVGDKLIC